MIDWEPISPKIIWAQLYGGTINISVIQGYASTNDTKPDTKEYSYNTLQGVLDKLANPDLIILIGDYAYTAKVGRHNTGREAIVGRHGEG